MKTDKPLIALAGQPNCGKSTVFNALTGARQHIANYPGVTVDKMVGWYQHEETRVEVVDLPGTYSMTSYSPEERVSRDFILHENPSVAVNIMDGSNLKRCLYLTFQLLEMQIPVILTLNMMDVAENRGISIQNEELSRQLGIPVVAAAMKLGRGKKELLSAIQKEISSNDHQNPARVDYKEMESSLEDIRKLLESDTDIAGIYPSRWVAIKLMEGDEEIQSLIRQKDPNWKKFLARASIIRDKFESDFEEKSEMFIAQRRYEAADAIAKKCLTLPKTAKRPLSDKIDTFACHKFLGPVIMVGLIWLLYYLAIVQGYNLTNYTWPLLAKIRNLTATLMPDPGFIDIPLIRAFALWLVDSVNALLNYIPIFFILFGLIAIMEDSGYMPRMAFIMDRLFSRYGLHGQSTLPMVLGGIYIGGCAVPGIMSCKGIPDERSRMATILIIPMLNCLAKIPLYILLINIYYAQHKGLAMFFISTISLLMVLPVSKLLTMTVLKDKETAPFVMEMPPYHLPSIRGVTGRALERVWMFIRKITTIVVALAIIIFILLQFPGISSQRKQTYTAQKNKAIALFETEIINTPYKEVLTGENLMAMILYWDDYKNTKMAAKNQSDIKQLKIKFKQKNPQFFAIAQPGKDKVARKVNKAFKKLDKTRKKLLRQMRKERIDNSLLGSVGKALVPVTKWAGFNWRVNVALLSAFAAKESSVATLGALYEHDEPDESLESRMYKGEQGFSSLHALALMMFMVLYPPCLATSIAVKLQSGSVKWMLFAMGYPMLLGIIVSTLVFSLGSFFKLTGLQAMISFYVLALLITILTGFIKTKSEYA